jgi:hypothetical protein
MAVLRANAQLNVGHNIRMSSCATYMYIDLRSCVRAGGAAAGAVAWGIGGHNVMQRLLVPHQQLVGVCGWFTLKLTASRPHPGSCPRAPSQSFQIRGSVRRPGNKSSVHSSHSTSLEIVKKNHTCRGTFPWCFCIVRDIDRSWHDRPR